jgi:hypothetical protein
MSAEHLAPLIGLVDNFDSRFIKIRHPKLANGETNLNVTYVYVLTSAFSGGYGTESCMVKVFEHLKEHVNGSIGLSSVMQLPSGMSAFEGDDDCLLMSFKTEHYVQDPDELVRTLRVTPKPHR